MSFVILSNHVGTELLLREINNFTLYLSGYTASITLFVSEKMSFAPVIYNFFYQIW